MIQVLFFYADENFDIYYNFSHLMFVFIEMYFLLATKEHQYSKFSEYVE